MVEESLSSFSKACASVRGLDTETTKKHSSISIVRTRMHKSDHHSISSFPVISGSAKLDFGSRNLSITFFIYQKHFYCAVPQTLVRQNNILIRILVHHKNYKRFKIMASILHQLKSFRPSDQPDSAPYSLGKFSLPPHVLHAEQKTVPSTSCTS